MGIFNNFPFTNFQEKNLDCIYKLAKEANNNATDALEHVNEALTNTDSLIERTTALAEKAEQLTEAVEAGEVINTESMSMVESFPPLPALVQIPAQDNYGKVYHIKWQPNLSNYSKLRTFLAQAGLDTDPIVLVGDVYYTITSDQANNRAIAQEISIFHLETMSTEAVDNDIATKYLIKHINGWVTDYPYHVPSPANPAKLYFSDKWYFYNLEAIELNI